MKNLDIKKMVIGAALLVVAYIGWSTFIAPMADDRNDRAEQFNDATRTIELRNRAAQQVRSNEEEVMAQLAASQAALPAEPLQQEILAEISARWGAVGVEWESVTSGEPTTGPFAPNTGRSAPAPVERPDDKDPAFAGSSVESDEEREAAAEAEAVAARASQLVPYDLNLQVTATDEAQLAAALQELRDMDRIVVVDTISVSFPFIDGGDQGVEASIIARYFAFEAGLPAPIPEL